MPSHRVLLFATLRDLVGQESVHIHLPANATVAQLRAALGEQYPALAPYLDTAIIAVNHTFTTDATPIHPEDEIAAFPPVSGG